MTDRQRLDLKLNVLVIMSVTEDTIGICIPCLVILCRAWLSIMSVTYTPIPKIADYRDYYHKA